MTEDQYYPIGLEQASMLLVGGLLYGTESAGFRRQKLKVFMTLSMETVCMKKA